MPPPTSEPPTLPKIERRTLPRIGTATSSTTSSVPKSNAARRRPLCVARHRRQRLTAIDDRNDPVDAGVDPRREMALAELRRDVLGDDPARRDVGQHALEAVADLDPNALVALGDQQDRAVVLALLSDLPGLGDAQRVLLDRLRARSSARSAPPADCRCALPSRAAWPRAPGARRPTACRSGR